MSYFASRGAAPECPIEELVPAGSAVSGVAAVLVLEAGGTVTEVGRQPWVVFGVLHTADAVTPALGLVWTSPLGRTYPTQPPPIAHDLPEPRPSDPDYPLFTTPDDDTPILERPPPQPDPSPPPTPPDPDEPPPF